MGVMLFNLDVVPIQRLGKVMVRAYWAFCYMTAVAVNGQGVKAWQQQHLSVYNSGNVRLIPNVLLV